VNKVYNGFGKCKHVTVPYKEFHRVPFLWNRVEGGSVPSPSNDPQHWRDRAAKMRELAVKMAGSQAAILINDLAVHYDELADQAVLKGQSPPNGKQR
jgi:hypothetical protein